MKIKWIINRRYLQEDDFNVLAFSSYKKAKKEYTKLVDTRFNSVILSDYEGEILFQTHR